MKIVITGCAGFIGANFTKYWLDKHKEDTVIGIDCLTYAANRAALRELCEYERFVFFEDDICDSARMDAIFAEMKPEAVVNFAAESHVDRSIEDSSSFVRTNVLGTQVLLDACKKHGVERFHQISTDEVYGDIPIESDERFDEDSVLNPSSPYSASKAAADMLALSYYRTHGLFVTVSRSANNFGIYQHEEKLIPKVISCVMRGDEIPVYGNGENIRDWISVGDHIRAVEAILLRGAAGQIYNVGGGKSISNISLVKKIIRIAGGSESVIRFVSDRKGHDRKYALSCEKIARELSWWASDDFDFSLERTVKWYINNK